MRALDNLIANEYGDTNGEALRNLDIIEVQDKILKMRHRNEDLEDLLYNIEDWVDEIIDDMSDQLKNNIAKKALEMIK